MPLYRVFSVDRNREAARQATNIDCDTDQAAIEYALRLSPGLPREVWQQARLVAFISKRGHVVSI